MPGVEREAAEAVENRLALIHLDRAGVVRSVTHHHVGAGSDRRVGDLDLVVEHILEQSPVMGGDQLVSWFTLLVRRLRHRRVSRGRHRQQRELR